MWEKTDHILNPERDSLQWWDYNSDNRPPYPPHTHKYTQSHNRAWDQNAISMQIFSTLTKICPYSVWLWPKLCLLCLTFWFMYTFSFTPSPHLSVSFSSVGLMQVLCIDQNVRARRCFTLLFLSLYLFMWHLVLLPHPAQCFAGIQML